jgi:hypothetical protein
MILLALVRGKPRLEVLNRTLSLLDLFGRFKLALELVDRATGLLNFLEDQLALKLVDRATSFVYEAALVGPNMTKKRSPITTSSWRPMPNTIASVTAKTYRSPLRVVWTSSVLSSVLRGALP